MDKEIKIPVFDGEDYSMWKIRIRMFLKLKKCETVITRERTTADKEEDWIEQDLKAMNIIYSAISNKQLEFVCNEDSAYKVIKKLDNMYLKESTALQIVCRNKLEKLRLSNFSDTATFFNEFEKSVNELRSAGAKICEREKLNYMLNTLPESYSYIGDLIDTLKEEDQTADYVKNKIKLAEMKNRSEDQETKTNVFAAKKNQRGRCHKCNKEGHFARDCPENDQAVKNNGTWRGSSRGRGRGRGGRGSNTRGRGYSNYQQQGARNDGEKNNTGASAWVARMCSAQGEKTHKNDMCAVEWLLDSGCTDHIANNERYFESLIVLKEPVKIYLGDNRVVKATKIGNITTYFNAFGCENRVDIKNVFYVKEMNANLISYGKLTEKNTIISKGDLTRIIDENNKVIAVGYKENRVIKLKGTLKENLNFVDKAERVNSISQKEKWHRTLGHVNFGYLNILCKQQLLEGVPKDLESEFMKCQTCIENKMTSLLFENNRKRAKEILEIVHTDVCGSFKTSGLSGEKYFVSFIDDYSKIAKVYCIKSKDEVYDCFVRFINESENITGKKIKYLRCDNGTEYLNNRFYKLAKEKGIILNKCPPYVHELNGTAERFNRTIMDMARCLLAEAKVDKKYWPEIICAATYLKNRTLANTIEKRTPYEIFFKKRPNVEHLCIYGSKVFVRKPNQKRTSKWDKRGDMGILLGYDKVGYRILMNNKIIIARHVEVVNENVKYINFDEDEYGNESIIRESDDNDSVFESADEKDEENVKNKIKNDELKVPRRTNRERKSPVRYPDGESNNIYVNYCRVESPCTFEEAINSEESENWRNAMNQELACIEKNKTWKLVDKPKDKKVLDVKWVYTRKSDNRYKARLVVRGFQQINVIEDIYAPVAKGQTLKMLFSYCCKNGLKIEQMDVEAAFLNGKVNSEVYVAQPKGYNDGTNKVYKLYKALYGLKESPRDWYECFDNCVTNLGFIRSNVDLCLYKKGKGKDEIYLLIYVDDLLICSKKNRNIKRIKELLSKEFNMKDLGEINEYLGININYDYNEGKMKLNQTKYIETLANKYQIENSKLYNTPMETNLKIDKAENSESNVKYRNLIGALLYISANTRPDISYSVNYLSRYQNSYSETHWKYALRILKYLYLTKELSLYFDRSENCELIECYVDADWAGDNIDRKSTSGYLIKLFGNVIDWKSRKQKCITKASAEYVALSELVSELKYIRELLKFFEIEINVPIKIYEDNLGALNIAKNGNFTKNSKHIEIYYHFVHESVREKLIDVCKIETNDNVADIFTKALCKEKFVKFRERLNLK